MNEVARHYDRLIDEGQDPVHDPQPLQEYMNKWDGQAFVEKMQLDKTKSVLEIGVGTGRIAVKVAAYCKKFTGIDISAKTIERAKKNIKMGFLKRPTLICADFLDFAFEEDFDVIYASLTLLHIKEKQAAFKKISALLRQNGLFVLSIDKNQERYIDMGAYKIEIYPDNPTDVKHFAANADLQLVNEFDTEFGNIFVFAKGGA